MSGVTRGTSPTGNKIVLYEDESIVAYRLAGQPGRLVVTFGDLVGCKDVSTFFGERMFEKYGVAAVGLMARRPNWYPEASVRAVRRLVADMVDAHDEIIVYGGSMGGYAAVKYSRMFEADIVLSLCPQVTADPNTLSPFDKRLRKHFREAHRGRSITADDIGGTVAVLVDHYDPMDLAHARAIAALSDRVTLHNIPFVGHHVTPIMAGGRTFAALVDAVSRADGWAITRLAREARRNAPHRIDTVLWQALRRRRLSPPRIAVFLWNRHRSTFPLVFLALYSIWRAAAAPVRWVGRLFPSATHTEATAA